MMYAIIILIALLLTGSSTSDDAEFESYEMLHGIGAPAPDSRGDQQLKDGRFCQDRKGNQCCLGRDDDCSVPIKDTLCYCDIFCDRDGPDCCPDYKLHCRGGGVRAGGDVEGDRASSIRLGGKHGGDGGKGGHRGQQGQGDDDDYEGDDSMISQNKRTSSGLKNNCFHHGHLYEPGQGIKENCNNCTCVNAVLTEEFNWKCTQKLCLIRPQLLQHIATSNPGWQGQNYSAFWGLSVEDGVKYKLGTFKPTEQVNKMTVLKVHVDDEIPEEFDARQQWPGLISPVLDQRYCAASWAFSTAAVASDRLRIHSNGAYKETLSPQHFISCNNDFGQNGCSSGHVDRAWWFMRKIGLVSDLCYPYTSGSHMDSAHDGGAHGLMAPLPDCLLPRSYSALKEALCPTGAKTAVYQASPPYKIAPNEREIMKEIVENGPVQAIMEVKDDFYMYKSGVYHHSLPADYQTSEHHKKTKYHSVRLLGWGTDHSSGKDLKYWLCANSWGTEWGEDGYFKMLRGTDECGIESSVIGVWIKANERTLVPRKKTAKTNGRDRMPQRHGHGQGDGTRHKNNLPRDYNDE